MADFNGSGFDAVNSFFGISQDESSSAKPTAKQSQRGKRLGVGALVQAPPPSLVGESERILKIGRKRKGSSYVRDEDSLDTSENESDEEHGRTTIDKGNRIESDQRVLREEGKEVRTKKKLGRKERERASAKAKADDDSKGKSDGEQPKNETMQTERPTKKSKRKRKKVRSRQKNIVKDKRDVKPAHLTPGSRDYVGRPMTQETRSKLNMPVIAKSPFMDDQWVCAGNRDDQHSSGTTKAVEKRVSPRAVEAPGRPSEVARSALLQKNPPEEKPRQTKSSKFKNF